jgi:hypothetical protein
MKKNPLKKAHLNPWEQEISDAFNRGEFVSVSDAEKAKYKKWPNIPSKSEKISISAFPNTI